MTTQFSDEWAQEDERNIAEIRVVAQTAEPLSPFQSQNHWSIYLALEKGSQHPFDGEGEDSNGEGEDNDDENEDSNVKRRTVAVRVSMSRQGGGSDGQLRWYDLDYLDSHSQLHYLTFIPEKATQIRDIARTIFSRGRENYTLSQNGSGCRYWVFVIIHDLCEDGILEESAIEEVWDDMQFLYDRTYSRHPMRWDQGTFNSFN